MQKIIDSAITVLLGLLVGSFFFFAVQAKAEPPNVEYYPIQSSPVQQSPVENVLSILLDQGFAGAIIVVLFVWTYKTDKNNRCVQKEKEILGYLQ